MRDCESSKSNLSKNIKKLKIKKWEYETQHTQNINHEDNFYSMFFSRYLIVFRFLFLNNFLGLPGYIVYIYALEIYYFQVSYLFFSAAAVTSSNPNSSNSLNLTFPKKIIHVSDNIW